MHAWPTSSSIIRRHGRVRTTVGISTGDRIFLPHFLPVDHATSLFSPSPRLFTPLLSSRPTAWSFLLSAPAATAHGFRLERLPVGGWTAPPRTSSLPVGRGRTRLSWRLAYWLHPRAHPSQHGRHLLVLPFFRRCHHHLSPLSILTRVIHSPAIPASFPTSPCQGS